MNDYLKQKLIRYTQNVSWEEVYIHSDKEEYVSGEELWFNAFLIDRKDFKISDRSRIVYFELLNTENRPIIQKRILLSGGFGPGQIVLPDTLSSGIYKIRAYTSWMKNFLPDNCFMKDIAIYNTLSGKPFRKKPGTSSISGKGSVNTVEDVLINNKPVINVDNSDPDSLKLFVDTGNKFRSENKNLLSIIIQTHGNINYINTVKVFEGISSIAVSKSMLGNGINQITIFNSMGEPISDRYVYTPGKANSIGTPESIDTVDLRSKVTLDIASVLSPELNNNCLSISVSPQQGDAVVKGLTEFLLFGTEFGSFPMNTIKGSNFSELPSALMDSILLNLKSNWINWDQILKEKLPVFKYRFEKEYHFLLGKLYRNDIQTPQSGSIVLMCTPGKEPGFQYARTNGDGNFSFNIHIDEELKDLVFMPGDLSTKSKIIIESSFSDQYSDFEISVDSAIKAIPSYVSKMSVNYQVRKIFGVSAVGAPSIQVLQPLNSLRFYGRPDIELLLADYISLPTMEEVFFELLPHITLKKKNSEYEISISDRIDDSPYFTVPFLLLDGVIVMDASVIADLDPEIVEKIDIIKGSYLVGKYIFPGLINVSTKSADFSCIPLPDYMVRLASRVVDPVYSFVSPDYSSAELVNYRIPDYRNTLYWNPSVLPGKDSNAKVEFWSSDNKSDYVITINGISKEGYPFSLKKKIIVK